MRYLLKEIPNAEDARPRKRSVKKGSFHFCEPDMSGVWCQEFRDYPKNFQDNDKGLRWLLMNAMFSVSGLLLVPQKPFRKT